jgi:RNA polymerase sigma-B factor
VSMSEFAAAEPLRLVPDAPAEFCQELSQLEDRELLALVGSLPRSSHRRAEAVDLLVARYRNLVRSCAQRYARSSVPIEDLMQVGYVGLLKAINNFDPALGFTLATYATPCITGELKRHFRDKSWPVRVGRPLQERVLEVRQAEQFLTQRLGRMPTDSELASDVGIRDADIREARQAELVLQPLSLDGPTGRQSSVASLAELLGEEDPHLEHMLGMQAIATHWAELPLREQQVVVLYYYRGMTQAHIGQQLGLSQMQVSRLLARALGYLRPRLFGRIEFATDALVAPVPRTGTAGAAPRQRQAVGAPTPNGLQHRSLMISRSEPADDGQPEQAFRREHTATSAPVTSA